MTGKENGDLEARLLEQEHRPFSIFWNFCTRKKRWPSETDPRRSAAVKALIWWCVSPGTIVVFGGGVVAIVALVLHFFETKNLIEGVALQREQNAQILIQNSNLQSQIDLQREQFDRSRRTALLQTLYHEYHVNTNTGQPFAGRIKLEALEEFVHRERTTSTALVNLENIQLSHLNLDGMDLSRVDFSNADFTGASLRGANLRHSILRQALLGKVDLTLAQLEHADLTSAFLNRANLFRARLDNATLMAAYLCNTDLRECNFDGAKLNGAFLIAVSLERTSFKRADLSGRFLGGNDIHGRDLLHSHLVWHKLQRSESTNLIRQLTGFNARDQLKELYDTIEPPPLGYPSVASYYSAVLKVTGGSADFRGADLTGVDFKDVDTFVVATADDVRGAKGLDRVRLEQIGNPEANTPEGLDDSDDPVSKPAPQQ